MALLWIALGFAAFGTLVGTTAGLSTAQLTTSLLGLLFALIGGSIGVLLGKLGAEDRKFAGVAMTAFSVCATLGLFTGIYVRINDLLRGGPHPPAVAARSEQPRPASDYLKSSDLPLTVFLQREIGRDRMKLEDACQLLETQGGVQK